MTKSRLEAFSDGVLAIIITIMVLELKTPATASWEDIRHLLPELGSYFLSFVYLGIYWGNHHHLIHTVKKVNARIMWANLHLLFWLSLIPFVTGWMGKSHFADLTVAIYGIGLLVSGLAYNVLNMAIKRSYTRETDLTRALHQQNRKGYLSLLLYATAVGLAFVNPVISYLLYLAVAIMWIVPDRAIERAIEHLEETA